jgi:hypothetical protein
LRKHFLIKSFSIMDSQSIQPAIAPIGDIGGTAGYAVMPTVSQASAGKYLSDSMLLDKLCDRVYELLQEDMRSQRERVRNYGSRRW